MATAPVAVGDGWATYPFEFKGGLVSNLPPLQQGTQLPGSARLLKNFEPSIDGGYRRIEGFDKYSNYTIPAYGEPVVQGSGQTGTTLNIANIFFAPSDGDIIIVGGVFYTIAPAGVSFNSTYNSATITLTSALATSPADKAAITFSISAVSQTKGVAAWNSTVLAYHNNEMYVTTGNAYTKINKPSYGTVLINGGSQTGTTLLIDGLSAVPQIGDTFSIAGVQKVYTVLAVPTVTTTAASLTIYPALASSPVDNAAVSWLSTDRANGFRLRASKYRISGEDFLMGVDGYNAPFKWDGVTFTTITGTADIVGASFVVFHKNQMFFAKDDKLIFTAPYTDTDFAAANGSGIISVGGTITGLIVFREVLIVFTQNSISQLTGNSFQDFNLQPITRRVGCIAPDTVQEVGGDVIFLGPEGLRLLGATDRVGDFNLGVVSKAIQKEMTSLISASSSFSSCVIKQKSQYRLFGHNSSVTSSNAKGVLGTQKVGDNTSIIEWAELVGINGYVTDSDYVDQTETIVFADNDGYVYQMENGNSFNGKNIVASFATPFVQLNDPRIRKTFYKMVLYTDPSGGITTSVNLKLDFDTFGSVQPSTIVLSNETGSVGFFGGSGAKYGTTVYGSKLKKQFETQVVGSGFSVSLQFISDGQNPPFSLDAATLEYSSHDRR